jgi:predicted S18 family serine protease
MRKLLLLLIGILLLTQGAFSQSQATTGNIEGRVVDQQGAAVPNVSVTARNQDTGFVKTVNSNEDGTYTRFF